MQQYDIPLARPYYTNQDILAVKKVIESRWVAQGPTTTSFEKEFAKIFKSNFAVALNSATSGLHLGLLALNIKKGDEVLVSDFTFPASGNSILYTGAKAIPVDVDLDTFNINMSDLEKKITTKSKAIMPVYALGNPPEMDKLKKIAKENGLVIIEDSACAHGSQFKNQMAGTFGSLGIFSFHARKIISTGEGGMVITNNEKMKNKITSLRSHGMNFGAWERKGTKGIILPEFDEIGFNYRMSDIAAAIGIVQLKRLDQFIEKRQKLANIYNELIEDHHLPLTPQRVNKNSKHNYQTYGVRTESQKIRNKIVNELKKRGIGSTIGTYSLSALPLFKGDSPNSKQLYQTTIALPMYHELKINEIKIIIREIKEILK